MKSGKKRTASHDEGRLRHPSTASVLPGARLLAPNPNRYAPTACGPRRVECPQPVSSTSSDSESEQEDEPLEKARKFKIFTCKGELVNPEETNYVVVHKFSRVGFTGKSTCSNKGVCSQREGKPMRPRQNGVAVAARSRSVTKTTEPRVVEGVPSPESTHGFSDSYSGSDSLLLCDRGNPLYAPTGYELIRL